MAPYFIWYKYTITAPVCQVLFSISHSHFFSRFPPFPTYLWETVPLSDNGMALLPRSVENLPHHKMHPLKCAVSSPKPQNNAILPLLFLHSLWKTHLDNSLTTVSRTTFLPNSPGFPHDFSTTLGETPHLPYQNSAHFHSSFCTIPVHSTAKFFSGIFGISLAIPAVLCYTIYGVCTSMYMHDDSFVD